MKVILQCSKPHCTNEVPIRDDDLFKLLKRVRSEVRYCEECNAHAKQQKLPGI